MTILYINYEHCTSMEQLRGYFEKASYDSPLFYDLLDYARSGDMSSWLREKGEVVLANQVDGIDREFGDSEYFSRLSALMTGNDTILDSLEKPAFSKCFQVEEVRQEETSEGMEVQVQLKVLSSVNETYEFSVRTSWGQKGEKVNPFREKKDEILTVPFKFRKRPNVEFKVVELLAEGNQLEYKKSTRLGKEVLEFKVDSCRFKMIRVEQGTFMMGSTKEQKTPSYDETVHQVELIKKYYIGETPVTQELWNSVMGNVPLTQQKLTLFPHNRGNDNVFQLDANKPIVNISLGDIENFIEKLNIKSGKHFRLPSNLEWELAASGDSDGFNNLDETAWHCENSNGKLHDVATKMPNANGLFDMIGNVWELTKDSFIRGGDYNTYILGDLPIEEFDVWHYSRFSSKAIGFRLVLSDDDSVTNMGFVDLGLSVLWASGAGKKPGGREPTIRECDELLKECKILKVGDNISKVIGPNGKYIYMKNTWYRIADAEGNKIIAFNPEHKQVNSRPLKSSFRIKNQQISH